MSDKKLFILLPKSEESALWNYYSIPAVQINIKGILLKPLVENPTAIGFSHIS